MKLLFASLLFLISSFFMGVFAQPVIYTAANAHSHNDYHQRSPFFQAYAEQFGSIEADIHLRNGSLVVGHDSDKLVLANTLELLYLDPLVKSIAANSGTVYKDINRKLQLLIDIKTQPEPTLKALVELLQKYPGIIRNKTVRIVITGNRPDVKTYKNYPSFIWFDGDANKTYSKDALAKIAMLSEDFEDHTKWRGMGELPDTARTALNEMIARAHAAHKPIRFYACPDFAAAWKTMEQLKVDYLNTDHIEALGDFLRRRNDSLRLMPFNRILHSAGEVIRFGDPNQENHALDAATITSDGKLVIEDRYGVVVLDAVNKKIVQRWSYSDLPAYKNYISTYSGITSFMWKGQTWILWSATETDNGNSAIMMAEWKNGLQDISAVSIDKAAPAATAIPNQVIVSIEKGEPYFYTVLNGNNELLKFRWSDKSIIWRSPTGVAPYGVVMAGNKLYVSNWAGNTATDSLKERAGVPWGLAYTDPRTGATAGGSVSVFDAGGKKVQDITVDLHPNAIIASKDGRFVYVSNASSDVVSVISTKTNTVIGKIDVGLLKGKNSLQGSSPNALALSNDNTILYVANGFDNAVAVVALGAKLSTYGKGNGHVTGYIPTEAYPGGLALSGNKLIVTNLESDGSNVISATKGARQIHNQLASVSIIPLPDKTVLARYTQEVAQLSLLSRTEQLQLMPREGIASVPVPERLGEPSVFKHVIYIIKENKTYDQVFGDMPAGKNDSSLCIFGERVTPNMHALAKKYGWMDDYYASGKSSAEGHQWTDAGMVSDYVEKNVRAWIRSYPHRQEDALVYNKNGFIWNQALDHGKTVRIYGEACKTEYDEKRDWLSLYTDYTAGNKPNWHNGSTIARVRPVIHPTYPDCDNINFTDQQRADLFMEEWKQFDSAGQLPNLMVLSLPNDHSAGTSPSFPTPSAMVADNDLAVGRIVDMVSKSKFWDSTVIFITQDDSQSGWDHISAYRTIGLTISPYSSGKLVTANYNQTSMLRTIEQILGVPPMNIMDGTARLMMDCFTTQKDTSAYTYLPNNIPLNQMNKDLKTLQGKARKYALQSQEEVFNEVDGGEDDAMNRILWFYAKGEEKYPGTK
ncbi:MAG: Phosphoesterase family protein [Ferruginibacter sp.]|uniref:alkaline phosphatase family protein n=1 Tax=Ferruginibacter sp. TaxID=1940288 RepID=UPI0026585244|nr:alkaline phosphatase family protein [Ferruginibacter sp.]MDB5275645.1 Phosphoesterase family protein [Ferruginibacter sp.]